MCLSLNFLRNNVVLFLLADCVARGEEIRQMLLKIVKRKSAQETTAVFYLVTAISQTAVLCHCSLELCLLNGLSQKVNIVMNIYRCYIAVSHQGLVPT